MSSSYLRRKMAVMRARKNMLRGIGALRAGLLQACLGTPVAEQQMGRWVQMRLGAAMPKVDALPPTARWAGNPGAGPCASFAADIRPVLLDPLDHSGLPHTCVAALRGREAGLVAKVQQELSRACKARGIER